MTTTVQGKFAEHLVLEESDRCDRCNAKAQVVVRTPKGGVLTFCGHHANEHAPKLIGSEYFVSSRRAEDYMR
jgi:uncharacterized Ntn-hydrolase superfamily protein